MFDVFIREAGARFGLGDKALTVAQMLLADMTSPDTGGLMGFLERFKAAGLGPVIQSWLGGGPSAQPISNSQLETVLGASGGLLARVTGLLEVNRDDVTTAIGYLLPAFVGRLTPGGSLPNAIERANLSDPGERARLLERPGKVVLDIAVDEGHGKLYWAEMLQGDYAQPAGVWRANRFI